MNVTSIELLIAQHVLVSCCMAIAEKIYLYEIDGESFLIGIDRLEYNAKYRYETLKIWSFVSDKFTLNYLTLKGKRIIVLLDFWESKELIDILDERGVEVERFEVQSITRNEGYLKHPIFELKDGWEFHLRGGRFPQMSIIPIPDSKILELNGYKDASEKKPKFLNLNKLPKKFAEAGIDDSESVDQLNSEFKKRKKDSKVNSAIGCLGGSFLWLIGTLIVVAIVIYFVSRVIG